ncbi:ATP-binding cassette, sub-B (MDR TAP), member 8 [Cladochytrium tenue]|nr:ATP-binding cassette, sub-B (MDR TAP), member 8 [Cladochytrium tenue]
MLVPRISGSCGLGWPRGSLAAPAAVALFSSLPGVAGVAGVAGVVGVAGVFSGIACTAATPLRLRPRFLRIGRSPTPPWPAFPGVMAPPAPTPAAFPSVSLGLSSTRFASVDTSQPCAGMLPPSSSSTVGASVVAGAAAVVVLWLIAASADDDRAGGGSLLHCEQQPDNTSRTLDVVNTLKTDLTGVDPTTKVDTAPSLSNSDLLAEIWHVVRPDWPLLISVVFVAAAAAAVTVQTPLAIGDLVSAVQAAAASPPSSTATTSIVASAWTTLARPAARLAALILFRALLSFVDVALVARLGERVALRTRAALAASMLRMHVGFFDSASAGDALGRLAQDVGDFKHTLKLSVTQGLRCVAQIAATAVQLARTSRPLTFALLAAMPILYFAMNIYGAFLRSLSRAARAADGRANAVFSEVVRAMGSAARVFEFVRLEPLIPIDSGDRPLGFEGYIEFKDVTFEVLILSRTFFTPPGHQPSFTGAPARPARPAPAGAQRPGARRRGLWGSGSRREGYPTRPHQKVLDDFNLRLPVGKLIERFYDPSSGAVLIDGRDLRTLDPSWLREHVGYINQEPTLFATTVMENIRYARPDASPDEVRRAAALANAHGFIQSFPDGYETLVGERGQKQRIAIARAILKDPKILILDEATSALDEPNRWKYTAESEKAVQDALERLMKDRTVLVIAHRLSTIRSADVIVVMNPPGRTSADSLGNIVEIGTHKTLMAKKGAYYRLHSQLSSEGGTI